MRVGDLGGLNDIYDENGELVLNPGERILKMLEGDNIDIWKGRHALRAKVLIGSTKEKGTIYITDKRLVFIRTPDPWLYYKTYSTPFALAEGIAGGLYSRDLKKLGLKVFAEIPYREVKSFKSHKKGKWMELRLEDQEGIPIRVDLVRLNRNDDKILLLEELLNETGATKTN